MDSIGSQIRDLAARVLTLEQRERRNADEILSLNKENKNLMKKMDSIDQTNRKLKAKLDSVDKTQSGGQAMSKDKCLTKIQDLKTKYDNLDRAVTELQQMAEFVETIKTHVTELNKTRLVLNRALAQSHKKVALDSQTKSSAASSGRVKTQNGGSTEEKDRPSSNNYEQLLERIRSLDRRMGCIDAIEDQLGLLSSWKEEKEHSDGNKFKKWDENMTSFNTKLAVFKDNLKEGASRDRPAASDLTDQVALAKLITDSISQDYKGSIFCASLRTAQPLGSEFLKINVCKTTLRSSNGPFDSQTGVLNPQEDSVFNLGWKIHQAGDGNIRYLMAIEGMNGRIFLGFSDDPGGVCSGSLIVPLKKGQRVWIEAKQMRGPDARIYSCNFMGWQMSSSDLGPLETLSGLQENLYNSLHSECQHL